MSRSRALVIALDGADPSLLQKMMDAGRLPAIQRLAAQGLSCRLVIPKALGNGVIWPTIHTGANAGRHGRYYFQQIRNGSYDVIPFREDSDLNCGAFWEYLSSQGLRVAILDAYKAALVKGINGRQVADWLTHGFRPHASPRSYPASEIEDIKRTYGEDPLGGSVDRFVSSNPDVSTLAELLKKRIAMRTALCLEWSRANDWDLFYLTMSEAHCAGHRAWHAHDPHHPFHDPETVETKGDPVEAVYVALDESIGEVLASIPRDSIVFLIAGAGMEGDFSANEALDQILGKIGGSARRRHGSSLKTLYFRYHRLFSVLKRLALRSPRIRDQKQRLKAQGFARGPCFALPYDEHSGAVRFNLKGRECRGTIAPGEELSNFRQNLENELYAIRYRGTDVRLVKQVVFKQELFSGDHIDDLPDAFVIWNRPQLFFSTDHPFTTVESPTIGQVSIPATARTGDHNENAIFITSRSGIPGGQSVENIGLVDVAPTICMALGQQLPDTDGRPHSTILSYLAGELEQSGLPTGF